MRPRGLGLLIRCPCHLLIFHRQRCFLSCPLGRGRGSSDRWSTSPLSSSPSCHDHMMTSSVATNGSGLCTVQHLPSSKCKLFNSTRTACSRMNGRRQSTCTSGWHPSRLAGSQFCCMVCKTRNVVVLRHTSISCIPSGRPTGLSCQLTSPPGPSKS